MIANIDILIYIYYRCGRYIQPVIYLLSSPCARGGVVYSAAPRTNCPHPMRSAQSPAHYKARSNLSKTRPGRNQARNVLTHMGAPSAVPTT